MAEGKPVRLQLSRRKGFSLQALSLATIGLPAVSVARPSWWCNPFKVGSGCTDAADAVLAYRQMVTTGVTTGAWRRQMLSELAGKNLACWCALDAPCHADVLLDIANARRSPPPASRG